MPSFFVKRHQLYLWCSESAGHPSDLQFSWAETQLSREILDETQKEAVKQSFGLINNRRVYQTWTNVNSFERI